MAIENYPVWTFEPNWSASVSETLDWLTDVMAAPDGSEQRRSLRYFPRRSVEFAIAVGGEDRQMLDNMLVTFGGARWYLPQWHEVNLLDDAAPAGTRFITSVDVRDRTGVRIDSVLCLIGDDAYTYEMVEVQSQHPNGVTVAAPLFRNWPRGTRVYQVNVAELTDQPQLYPRTGNSVTAEIRFRITDAEFGYFNEGDANLTTVYRGSPVLIMEPDFRERMNIDYERNFSEIDNQTAVPQRVDEAKRPFTTRQYAWTLDGRLEHYRFEKMLQLIRGRAIPLWVPTFMDDFTLTGPILAGSYSFEVGRCGFAAAGGPRWDRQDIMIETVSGVRIFRRIVGGFEYPGGERVNVDQAFTTSYPLTEILRISFVTLMRLNHDTVQIEHLTDTDGVSTSMLTFRSAPNTRIPLPAFRG